MSSEQANYRAVLASFLEKIPKSKGWWYRLPLAPKYGKDGKPLAPDATDAIMPHLGNVFGLSEQAMLLFLVEIGCYQAKGKRQPGSRMAADQSKNEIAVVDKHHLPCVSPAEVSANDAKRINVYLPMELVVWWVSERIDY